MLLCVTVPAMQCSVPGCKKNTRSPGSSLCGMHYHRQYRHGDIHKTGWGKKTNQQYGRYRRVTRKGHPLARPSGEVWEHRAVLYDQIGEGPHACHYCGAPVQWRRGGPHPQLQTDHLNRQKDDNRPENLVACCPTCNTRRGQADRHERMRAEGWWSNHDTVAQQGRSIKPEEFA